MYRALTAIRTERARLEFFLLSKEEREDLLKQYAQAKETSSEVSSRIEKFAFQQLESRIPMEMRIGKEDSKPDTVAPDESFAARFEKTAHDAVQYGVKRLAATLEEIRTAQGKLPTVILYPETSSRPLRYAVKPLLDLTYRRANQAMPREVFVKTFSQFATKTGREINWNDMQDRMRELLATNFVQTQERDALIRFLKGRKGTAEEMEQASARAQELWRLGRESREQIRALRETIGATETGAQQSVTDDRVREVLTASDSGPVIVVDDVFSAGRTFGSLHQSLAKAHRSDQAYFFSFASTISRAERLREAGLDPERFSTGISFSDEELGDDSVLSAQSGLTVHPPTAEEFDRLGGRSEANDWADLVFFGFPYRVDKRAATGVLKDQFSLSPYSELAAERDPKLIQAVRKTYRDWGEEAVKELEQTQREEAA